jgi:hypothetical protein
MKVLLLRRRIDAAKEDQTIRLLRRMKRGCDLTVGQQARIYRWEKKNERST